MTVSSEWRVGSWRSRPIGASMRPLRERGRPRTSAEVLPRQLAPAQEPLQASVRLVRAGDHEEPGCVAVEPVDDPGAVALLPALDRVREQAVDERAGAVPRRRVHDDAGRLVHDEQVLVLVATRRPATGSG